MSVRVGWGGLGGGEPELWTISGAILRFSLSLPAPASRTTYDNDPHLRPPQN